MMSDALYERITRGEVAWSDVYTTHACFPCMWTYTTDMPPTVRVKCGRCGAGDLPSWGGFADDRPDTLDNPTGHNPA